jgi:hypothetical protein
VLHVLGWAGLGWAGLGWAGLGWWGGGGGGVGWAGLASAVKPPVAAGSAVVTPASSAKLCYAILQASLG